VHAKEELRNALRNVDSPPAIPDIVLKILSLNLTAGKDNETLFELIAQDSPIKAKIIGLSNSPMLNRGRVISRLDHAVAFLGFKRVKTIALGFSIISSVTKRKPGQLDIQSLWDHSMAFTVIMDTLVGYIPQTQTPSR
jgi:HD-like signal output (HDOD) protein